MGKITVGMVTQVTKLVTKVTERGKSTKRVEVTKVVNPLRV